jgi:hypothetical protein
MSNVLVFPIAIVTLLAAVLAMAAAARGLALARRRRRRAVEPPNSHHTWERVREREAHDRWREMPLERIHPINREEVVRLLARVQAAGSGVLRPQERHFLDYMADLTQVQR